ncbi:MAG: copper chaperone PCu(A)C [Woeseiaceae bacterium]|nr:copper chaperone PCu(A)C [Woeseiaceae bacterium]
MNHRIGAILLVVAATLVACSGETQPPLVADDVRISGPMPRMKAGYMTLTNNTDEAIRITRVSSPQFGRAEIHETFLEDDVARMRPVGVLTIPAGDAARLEPGGKHLMLMQPVDSPQTVTLNLYSDEMLLLSVLADIE